MRDEQTTYDAPTPQERALYDALRERGILVERHKSFSYTVAGEVRYFHPDLALPEIKLCLEIDGNHHRSGDQRVRDQLRDAALRAHGWDVKHLPNFRVNYYRDFEQIVDDLVDAVRCYNLRRLRS